MSKTSGLGEAQECFQRTEEERLKRSGIMGEEGGHMQQDQWEAGSRVEAEGVGLEMSMANNRGAL